MHRLNKYVYDNKATKIKKQNNNEKTDIYAVRRTKKRNHIDNGFFF